MDLQHARQLAIDLIEAHGLAPRWKFAFDRAIRRFGNCDYTRRRITLSAPLTLLNDEEKVKDTILHEIAHALAHEGGRPRTGVEGDCRIDRLHALAVLWK